METDRLIGRECPWGGRPDHDTNQLDIEGERDAGECLAQYRGRRDQRELHIDRGRGVIFILDFRLSQGGLVRRAPEHRLQSFIYASPLYKCTELTNDRGLIAWIHREIGMLPIAQDAEPLKLLALNPVILFRILPAEPADGRGVERFLLVAEFFED